MITALVLAGLGARDLAAATGRGRRSRWAPLVLACLVVLALGAALALVLGPAPGVIAAALSGLGAAGAWHALAGAAPRARLVALAGVVLLAAVEAAGPSAAQGSPRAVLTVVAAGLALLETANVLTRDVLTLAGRPSSDVAPEEAPAGGSGARLQGGRFIGPMERLLMAGLGLAQAWPVVAALMAAKGIVRFPEISRDAEAGASRGAGAEEFLVGSLASWSLAACAAVLVHLATRPG